MLAGPQNIAHVPERIPQTCLITVSFTEEGPCQSSSCNFTHHSGILVDIHTHTTFNTAGTWAACGLKLASTGQKGLLLILLKPSIHPSTW